MITWGAFRGYLRTAILNDSPVDPAKRRWSDAQLLIYLGWAQNALCAHTAYPKAAEIDVAAGDNHWTAPTDIYQQPSSLEDYGLISLVPTGGGKEQFYNPRGKTKGAGPGSVGNYFYVTSDGNVRVAQDLTLGGTLSIRYFAYYPLPAGVDDTAIAACNLYIPDWAQDPVAYLLAAHALAGYSMDAASIKMWAEAPEKGSPESNPFRAQQKWFLEVYERAIARIPIQSRVNYYRYA